MLLLGRSPSEALRTSLATAELSYAEVGGTRAGSLPPGYHHERRDLLLGSGDGAWSRARHGLQAWKGHEHADVSVWPPDAPLATGTVVLLHIGIGRLGLVAPCRVVYVVDEPDRYGFAYGTLPGHPERGEEAFVIERGAGGEVRFAITAFSRPAGPLLRLAGPVSRAVQARTTAAYLEGLRRHVNA